MSIFLGPLPALPTGSHRPGYDRRPFSGGEGGKRSPSSLHLPPTPLCSHSLRAVSQAIVSLMGTRPPGLMETLVAGLSSCWMDCELPGPGVSFIPVPALGQRPVPSQRPDGVGPLPPWLPRPMGPTGDTSRRHPPRCPRRVLLQEPGCCAGKTRSPLPPFAGGRRRVRQGCFSWREPLAKGRGQYMLCSEAGTGPGSPGWCVWSGPSLWPHCLRGRRGAGGERPGLWESGFQAWLFHNICTS